MEKSWKCEVCGYIHEGSEPPDVCPVCGAGKEAFSEFKVVAAKPSTQPHAPSSLWRCAVCDYPHKGADAPDSCPVCGADKNLFEAASETQKPAADLTSKEQIVVIGGGVAGLTAAGQARRTSSSVQITVLSKEPVCPYYRLNLTRYLAGQVSEKDLTIHNEDWYEENNIKLRFAEVWLIEPQSKTVILNDKKELKYDRLIIASGAHSFIPPFLGSTRRGVFGLRTIDDAREILEMANKGSKCVCIGGGLLGLETAGALKKRGLEVTVVEGYDYLLPRQLPRKAGLFLKEHLSKLGINVMLSAKVKEIVGDENAQGVLLEGQKTLPADFVVISTGVRSNSYIGRKSGIEVKSGIIVNQRMETSIPGIYAAGDVAEFNGRVHGIWPTGYAQGAIAGINAAGGDAAYSEMPPANQLKVLDIDVFSVGLINPPDGSYTIWEHSKNPQHYQRILCRDGRAEGAALYGDITISSQVKEAVETREQLLTLPELLDKCPGLEKSLK